jgi:hypothetical protein
MSRFRASCTITCVALVALAACGEVKEIGPRELCLVPAGTVFLPNLPGTFTFEPGAPLELVAAYQCVDEPLESECDITFDGKEVTAHTSLEIRIRERIGEDDSCDRHVVACAAPPLAAGTYQLRFGPRTIPFAVPSTAEAPCLFNLPQS